MKPRASLPRKDFKFFSAREMPRPEEGRRMHWQRKGPKRLFCHSMFLARRRLRPARRIRQFDRDGCRTAGFSRLAYGGTEDLMGGECLGAISILRLLFHWGVPVRILFKI
jgi:hypothetical protein